jgi:hypothetical protein
MPTGWYDAATGNPTAPGIGTYGNYSGGSTTNSSGQTWGGSNGTYGYGVGGGSTNTNNPNTNNPSSNIGSDWTASGGGTFTDSSGNLIVPNYSSSGGGLNSPGAVFDWNTSGITNNTQTTNPVFNSSQGTYANDATGGNIQDVYIGSTNWANLQNQIKAGKYTAAQIAAATRTGADGKKYWRGDVSIDNVNPDGTLKQKKTVNPVTQDQTQQEEPIVQSSTMADSDLTDAINKVKKAADESLNFDDPTLDKLDDLEAQLEESYNKLKANLEEEYRLKKETTMQEQASEVGANTMFLAGAGALGRTGSGYTILQSQIRTNRSEIAALDLQKNQLLQQAMDSYNKQEFDIVKEKYTQATAIQKRRDDLLQQTVDNILAFNEEQRAQEDQVMEMKKEQQTYDKSRAADIAISMVGTNYNTMPNDAAIQAAATQYGIQDSFLLKAAIYERIKKLKDDAKADLIQPKDIYETIQKLMVENNLTYQQALTLATQMYGGSDIVSGSGVVDSNNRGIRNNNWGNLKGDYGYGSDEKGFAIFPDKATGDAQILKDLNNKKAGNTRTGLGPNSTLSDLIDTWNTGKDGYLGGNGYVNTWLQSGYTLNTKLEDIDMSKLLPYIQTAETGVNPNSKSSINNPEIPGGIIEYPDGSRKIATSNNTWRWEGPNGEVKEGVNGQPGDVVGTPTNNKNINDADMRETLTQYLQGNNYIGQDGKVAWETYRDMLQFWIDNNGTEKNFYISFPKNEWLDKDNQNEFNDFLGIE